MELKPKKNWTDPVIQSFGTSGASQSGQSPAMIGQNCGETTIRYGPSCGIRFGQECTPRIGSACYVRIGHECLPRIGPSCMARFGAPCSVRTGTECGAPPPLPGEPLPPGR